jgi:hypothetical protein
MIETKLTQLDNVKTGDYARVKCVKAATYCEKAKDYITHEALPIIDAPPHSDSKIIKFDSIHFHYDYRFLEWEVIEQLIPYWEQFDPSEWPGRVLLAEEVIGEPFYKILQCHRSMPIAGKYLDFVVAIEDYYLGQKVENFKCPHQGYRLQPVPQDDIENRDRCAFACPGHGLATNAEGVVIRRVNDRCKTRSRPTGY